MGIRRLTLLLITVAVCCKWYKVHVFTRSAIYLYSISIRMLLVRVCESLQIDPAIPENATFVKNSHLEFIEREIRAMEHSTIVLECVPEFKDSSNVSKWAFHVWTLYIYWFDYISYESWMDKVTWLEVESYAHKPTISFRSDNQTGRSLLIISNVTTNDIGSFSCSKPEDLIERFYLNVQSKLISSMRYFHLKCFHPWCPSLTISASYNVSLTYVR